MPHYEITNNRAQGSYTVLNAVKPVTVFAKGDPVVIELTEAEAKNAEASGISIVKAKAPKAVEPAPAPIDDIPPVIDPPTQAELAAKALKAEPELAWHEFKTAAREVLGDETPATKADIIEALQALIPTEE